MGKSAKLAVVALGTLLLATITGIWWGDKDARFVSAAAPAGGIDRRLLDAAHQLASFAETPAEQELHREAVRLADHEIDQAFASALREAAAAKPSGNGALKEIQARIEQAKSRIAASQARIAKLPKDDETQIALANARLALDQDELEDAQADLAREGGDARGELERALAEFQATQRSPVESKPVPAGSTNRLAEQTRTWLVLRDRATQVADGRRQAALRAGALIREHKSLDALVAQKPAPAPASDPDEETEEDAGAMLARLRQLSDQRKTLTEL